MTQIQKKRTDYTRRPRLTPEQREENRRISQKLANMKSMQKRRGTEGHIRPLKEDYEALNRVRISKGMTWHQFMNYVLVEIS